jgi:hypothetical protein
MLIIIVFYAWHITCFVYAPIKNGKTSAQQWSARKLIRSRQGNRQDEKNEISDGG